MRLDKFLCENGCGTRSQVKQLIKQGRVWINKMPCRRADAKIDENSDEVCVDGCRLIYSKYVYYMFHKPAGCVSATKDPHDKTVLDFIQKKDYKTDLFPVGRLDKDTEGLLLITNDGALAHRLLSPKKHIPKTYYVKIKMPLSKEAVIHLEEGLDIGEEKKTLPAKVEVINDSEILLTISEGKFHQVKRMLSAVGNEVLYLKRLSMGGLKLDENLKLGEYRALTGEEIEKLC